MMADFETGLAVGLRDAFVYFASANGVSTWRVDNFHIDWDKSSGGAR